MVREPGQLMTWRRGLSHTRRARHLRRQFRRLRYCASSYKHVDEVGATRLNSVRRLSHNCRAAFH
eukprot:3003053-Alexandrium_andersonii.AAC.1